MEDGMVEVARRAHVAGKRAARAQDAVVEFSVSDNGVATVTASKVLRSPGAKEQLAAVKQLRLAASASNSFKRK